MKNVELVERAKMYLKLLSDGVHPVTGEFIPSDAAIMDERVKKCFEFITEVLDEYVEMSRRVEKLEDEKVERTIVIPEKLKFAITREQCESIKLTRKPVSILSFMKAINSCIDSSTMETLTSTRVNKWLIRRGLISQEKVQTLVSKTVYKPSEQAERIGIIEEEKVDKKSGEVKTSIKLSESAQLFIIENLEEIVSST